VPEGGAVSSLPPPQSTLYGRCISCGKVYLWRVVNPNRTHTHFRARCKDGTCPGDWEAPLRRILASTYMKAAPELKCGAPRFA
jgi:hypothetical protein